MRLALGKAEARYNNIKRKGKGHLGAEGLTKGWDLNTTIDSGKNKKRKRGER